MRRRWRLVVQVEWLSQVGAGLGGPFGVDVVAWRIWFLVWGGAAPVYRPGSGVERLIGGAAIPCCWCCSCTGGCGPVG